MIRLTEQEAQILAMNDKFYRARQMRGEWIVWCDVSDHEVEFDEAAITCARINAAIRFSDR